MEQAVRQVFGASLSASVSSLIVKFCSGENVEAAQVYNMWEAYALSNGCGDVPSESEWIAVINSWNKDKERSKKKASVFGQKSGLLKSASKEPGFVTPVTAEPVAAKKKNKRLKKGDDSDSLNLDSIFGSRSTTAKSAAASVASMKKSAPPLSIMSTDMFFDIDMYSLRDDAPLAPKNLAKDFDDETMDNLDGTEKNSITDNDLREKKLKTVKTEPSAMMMDTDITEPLSPSGGHDSDYDSDDFEVIQSAVALEDMNSKMSSFTTATYCSELDRLHRASHATIRVFDYEPINGADLPLEEDNPYFDKTFRYMNDPIVSGVQLLKDRIRSVSRRFVDSRRRHNIPVSEPRLDGFHTASQQRRVICGRVCWDLEDTTLNVTDALETKESAAGAGGGSGTAGAEASAASTVVAPLRANGNAVLLESSAGHRIKLDLSRVQANSFLARGQVIVVEGINLSGSLFTVENIWDRELVQGQENEGLVQAAVAISAPTLPAVKTESIELNNISVPIQQAQSMTDPLNQPIAPKELVIADDAVVSEMPSDAMQVDTVLPQESKEDISNNSVPQETESAKANVSNATPMDDVDQEATKTCAMETGDESNTPADQLPGVAPQSAEIDVQQVSPSDADHDLKDLPKPTSDSALSTQYETTRLLICAGPYIHKERAGLSFGPMIKMLKLAVAKKAQTIVLLGPFIDIEDPHFDPKNSFFVDESLEQVFEKHVVTKIKQFQKSYPLLNVVLVPHLSDAHHCHVAPQPPFIHGNQYTDSLFSIGNPGIFSIHGSQAEASSVSVAVCSMPVIEAISANCLCSRKDRINEMCGLIERQRFALPIFPPPPNIPLDYGLAQRYMVIPENVQPGIFIVVSRLGAFVKRPDGASIFINPGQIVKKGVSSYAQVDIQMPIMTQGEDEHKVNYAVSIHRFK